jgi:hypothetical protein
VFNLALRAARRDGTYYRHFDWQQTMCAVVSEQFDTAGAAYTAPDVPFPFERAYMIGGSGDTSE